MDVATLIKMVRAREPIWNRQHPQYKDRELAAKLWGQVAGQLNVDVESARYKWRGLRDTFRVQLRKQMLPNGDGMNLSIPKWEYFNEMMFVKEQINLDSNRRTLKFKGYTSEFEENNYFDGCSQDDYLNFDSLCETEMTEGDQVLNSNFQSYETPEQKGSISEDSSSRLTINEANEEGNALKDEIEKIVTNIFLQDDNLCFLLSLLPQLKSLPNKRNLYVRLKMQEVLLSELASTTTDK